LTCFEPNWNEARKIPRKLNADVRELLVADLGGRDIDLRLYSASDFASVFPIEPELAARYGIDDRRFETLTVPAVTLDDQELPGSRLYLKIDTQGSEARVLRGGRRLLERVCVVQAELPFLDFYKGACKGTECLEILSELGFHLTRLFPVTYSGECIVDADAFFERAPAVGAPKSSGVAEMPAAKRL
jgi:FkbM family methyltransferase